MTRTPRPVTRALATIATVALAASGLVVGVALPANATESVAFSTIPDALAPNYASLGGQAYSQDEIGDYIQLAGTDRDLTTVSVGMSSWACETGGGATCVTTPGSTFTHPITVNIYEADTSGVTPVAGDLIATSTKNQAIPFRPSADPTCAGGTAWRASNGNCYNGYAFTLDFDFRGVTVPDDIVVGVAYNTETHGVAPLGVSGPYNSLNVALVPVAQAPFVGTDGYPAGFFWDTLPAFEGDDTFAASDYYGASYNSIQVKIGVTGSTEPAASTVTVYDKDVKAFESTATYLDWHESKTITAGSYASVQADGLHLGDGDAVGVIKGVDPTSNIISKTQLLELITSASVEVSSGSITFQVPVFFGNPSSPSFTTLRSTDLAADSTFSQFDTWATTRAFGPYAVQEEAPLGELLDALYAVAGPSYGVALAGFGVQANVPAVVPALTWDGTTYEFFQPEIAACTPSGGVTATNLDSNGWSFAETRSQGHNVFTEDGLHVYTDAATTQSKAAAYIATNFALSEVGVPVLNLGATSGGVPSIQLVTDFDNNGVTDGILVGETVYGNDYWLSNGAAQFVKDGAPSHTGGFGSSNHGTLAQWLIAFPEARVLKVGYSLGSGVLGSAYIESIVAGCQTFSFTTATPPGAGTQVNVTEFDIRPDEATYPGWHEGYTNTSRAFSVQSNGLHLGDGVHSQILFGLDAPLATTELESIITGSTLAVSSGSVSFQFPVLYGATDKFTTLRSASLATTGTRGVSVSDVWVTTRAIYANDGTTVILPAGSTLSVADFATLLGSIGNVRLLGYGVQADASAVVTTLTANGTQYTFTPYVAPPVTATVRVPDSEIRPDESTYPGWHEGYTNAQKSYTVTENGLVLGTPLHSQIIKGLDAPLTSPSVGLLIAGASVDVVSGSVTYQVPIYYGAGTDFLTLRSASLGAGSHSFGLASLWASSKTVPGLGIVAHQLYPLGDLLDKLTNVRVLAFGVQADSSAIVSSIVFNQTEYVFDGPLVAGNPVITGTPKVGDTLTANPGTWAPAGVTFTYEWKSNGAPIPGATASTYVLTSAEANDTVVVVVTGSAPGFTSVEKVSPGVTITPGALVPGTPTISGTAEFGGLLAANPGIWGPAPVSLTYQWFSGGDPIPGETGSFYTISASDAGKAITLQVTGTKVGYTTASVMSAPTVTLPTDAIPVVDRISGSDRFESAVNISQKFAPDVARVYLASGLVFPDALSAAPAAAHDNVPLLLTLPNGIPTNVRAELIRLSPEEIVVVGGPVTVNDSVLAALRDLPFDPEVVRVGGADRYETSRNIAARAFPTAATAYIATGVNFPDALAAAPAAARVDAPVILVYGLGSGVDAATETLLDDLGVTNVTIAGGPLTVSAGIQTELETTFTVKRPYGADRYLTAIALNEDAFDSSTRVYIATGEKFPDALAGAALAGSEGAPLYLSSGACLPGAVLASIMKLDPTYITLLGGPLTLSAKVYNLEVCS